MEPSKIPLEVALLFDDLIANEHSKAELARQHEVSTRTIGRWMEKYNFDTYRKMRETPKKPKPIPEEVIASISDKPKTVGVSEQARKLFNEWKGKRDKSALEALKLFKSMKKKSWLALGFTQHEEEQIKKASDT